MGVEGAGDTPTHASTALPVTEGVENNKLNRPRTLIIEDPNEDRSASPIPPVAVSSIPSNTEAPSNLPVTTVTASATVSDSSSSAIATSSPSTSVPKSDTPIVAITLDSNFKGVEDNKPKDEKTKEDKPKEDKPKDVKLKEEKPADQKSTLKAPEPSLPVSRPVTPTGERGKSKTTGKTISGWL